MRKYCLFIVVLSVFMMTLACGKLIAQDTLRTSSDSLVVYNTFVSYGSATEVNQSSAQGISSDTLANYSIGFKVNFPGSINELYILIGSQKDSSDYKLITLQVRKESGVNYIYLDNIKISKFWKRDASYNILIPNRKINTIKWVSIYALDKFGKFSKKDYFNFQ